MLLYVTTKHAILFVRISLTTVLGAQTSFDVQMSSEQEFLDRWTGQGCPLTWLAKSLDVKPSDFFCLWEYIKDCVFNTPVANIDDMRTRIKVEIANILLGM